MNTTEITLEFNKIKEMLAELALSSQAKEALSQLSPFKNARECQIKTQETTEARHILESLGNPPLSTMTEIDSVLSLCEKGVILSTAQLENVAVFTASCRRMKSYLKRAESLQTPLASYGNSIFDLSSLQQEIERSIRSSAVQDSASPKLRDLRRRIDGESSQIKKKLDDILRSKKHMFTDSYLSARNGRCVLPVKKEFKNQVNGSVVDISASGGTYFIEPATVRKVQEEIDELRLEEENEIRRILAELTALVDESSVELRINMEAMTKLDTVFAKAKLSLSMNAQPADVHSEPKIHIAGGRHPLLNPGTCVPLDFQVGGETRGVVITGPNTGGKTVSLKTVGLLSLMAGSGLHVPAESASFPVNDLVLCDIGDGQSIAENLSTFSAHITNITEILRLATQESLVLLDELGSGTDPAEGMGIAIAVLEELCRRGCLFVATTHYPEVKEFAGRSPGLTNARMAFDRDSLRPLYRLEIGEAGESCALHIAERLGFPGRLLRRAREHAYGDGLNHSKASITATATTSVPAAAPLKPETLPVAGANVPLPAPSDSDGTDIAAEPAGSGTSVPDAAPRAQIPPETEKSASKRGSRPAAPAPPVSFQIGDSVAVSPEKDIGIVFQQTDSKGMVGVQIKGKKCYVNHKRLTLKVAASELYPPDYDFSIVFDTVENRKARHRLEKGYKGTAVTLDDTSR